MKQRKYVEQYERMERWFKIYEKINDGILVSPSVTFESVITSEIYRDYVFFFFQNCYHLKDWIIYDFNNKAVTKKVESFVNDNFCMSLCADLCNSIKHLSLKKSRSKRNPEFTAIPDYTEVKEGKKSFIYIQWFVKANGEYIDAFQIATECMKKWAEFINAL